MFRLRDICKMEYNEKRELLVVKKTPVAKALEGKTQPGGDGNAVSGRLPGPVMCSIYSIRQHNEMDSKKRKKKNKTVI